MCDSATPWVAAHQISLSYTMSQSLLKLMSIEWVMPSILHAKLLTQVQLFVAPRTVACQAPLSVGFSRQEYGSGLPIPSPGYLPKPEIEPESLRSPALAGRFFTTSATWEALLSIWFALIHKITFEVQTTFPLLQNFYITWLLPLLPQSNSLGVTWDAVFRSWSPKNSHQIKQSTFRWWLFFFLVDTGLQFYNQRKSGEGENVFVSLE